MKKFLSLLTALTLLVGMMSAFTAAAAVNTTAFYNAADDSQVYSLDNVNSIYATTTFTGRYEDNASVIVAHYNASGKLLKVESIVPVESTIGASVTYTTPDISVADTDILKVFAWTGVETIKPLLQFPGIISRDIPLPTATVTELDVAEITTVPLTIAMNFKADPATEAQLLAYGNWYADFELTVNKDVTFSIDGTKDGYLAGQYDSWSPAWVQVPVKGEYSLPANTPLKIMETGAETMGEPGLKYTYQEVYDRVKDFDCGVFFTDAFLAANPDVIVTLELRMYNPLDESESYVIGETYTFGCTVPTATVTELNVEEVNAANDIDLDFGLNFLADDVNELQLAKYGSWYADFVLVSNKNMTLNANGGANGYLAGQYDGWSENWVSVPFEDTAVTANVPVKIMETAAAQMNQSGLKLTYADVYSSVRDFDCGVSFTDEFLAANPDLEVSLELRMYNPEDESEYYVIGETYIYKPTVNATTASQTLTAGNVTAEVPTGVVLNDGVTELVLTSTALEESASGLEVSDNQELSSTDVHIEGVSPYNTTPIIITMAEAAQTGLNKGNLTLYHVENGVAVQMTEVASKEDLTQHNQFTYDPATGTIVMALATFSEIAVVSDTENVWNGTYDYSWYNADATELTIANADQMAGFGAIVGGMAKDEAGNYICDFTDDEGNSYHYDSFAGKTVKLLSDLNYGGAENGETNRIVYYPVGYHYEATGGTDGAPYSTVYSFEGTFDGNGNTISNIYQTTWIMEGDYTDPAYEGNYYYDDAMGIFGYVKGTVKNLTAANFYSVGEFTPTGVIAAYAGGNAVFENIQLENCNPQVYNTGNGGIVGCNGSSTAACNLTFRNITIDQTNKISALWGSWDVGCGGIMGMLYGSEENFVTFDNCHVAAIIDVNNDVCANYQYYQYRYAGMYLGTVKYHINDNGVTRPAIENHIKATNCTATYGDWNEYWYCELVANSLASYTHDHQFSRLVKISDVSDIQDENGNWTKTGNFVIPAADNSSAICYHIMKDAEGNLYQHKHEDSGYETTDVDGDGVVDSDLLKEDRQCYYIPFGQLFTGYGWGVRAAYTVQNDDGTLVYPNIDIQIKDGGTVTSQEKFESTGVTSVAPDVAVNVTDLFQAKDGVNISSQTTQVFVSPADETSTVSATYAQDPNEWNKGTVTFTGEGKAKVTITDYFYCTATTIYVTVGEGTVAVTAPSTIDEGAEFVAWVTDDSGLSSVPDESKNYVTLKYSSSAQNYSFKFKLGAEENGIYELQVRMRDNYPYYTAYAGGLTFEHHSGNKTVIGNATKLPCTETNWGTVATFDLSRGDHEFTIATNDTACQWSVYGMQLVKVGDSVDPLPGVGGTAVEPTPDPTPTPGVETDPTAPGEMDYTTFLGNITEYQKYDYNAAGFIAIRDYENFGHYFKVKVGVETSGYYSISALMTTSSGSTSNGVISFATDDGQSATVDAGTVASNQYYTTSNTIYLTRGDNILTVTHTDVGNAIYFRGLKLVQ